ncbi:MAG TPA: hypothetical protein VN081_04140 [Dongiaceae bacterium]|nr:hypothetical protein [Dongiaceae bacterium]
MNPSYWQKQTSTEPLFPDIEWSKPEQRAFAGKLGVIGGNKLGFAGVAEAYSVAQQTGVGQLRVVLPDVLRKTIPASMTDVVFAPTNPSGSLSKDAAAELANVGAWADGILLIGDAGRSSETAILYEQFLQAYHGPIIVTRDAIDLIKNNSQALVERPQTLIIASFAQVQKLFQAVYYPKVLTFSMQLTNLVEALHKFTISYPVTIAVLHRETFIVAHGGEVVTTPWDNPMNIWRGITAAKAAAYWLWNPSKPLAAVATSLMK